MFTRLFSVRVDDMKSLCFLFFTSFNIIISTIKKKHLQVVFHNLSFCSPFDFSRMYTMADYFSISRTCSRFDYLMIAITSVMFIAAYFITNMLFCPIWYVFHKNKKYLCENPPFLDGCWRIDALKSGLGNPRTELGLDYTDVEFNCGETFLTGNRTLRGWLIPNQNHDTHLCVVVCHGGGRDRRQHLRHVPHLHKCGAAVLLFDTQEHGLSDGNKRGVGWFTYEASDVYAACKYMKIVQNFENVVAMGSSFGGVGVITAAGHFDKPGKNQMIDAVIAENPPHSRLRFVRELIYQHGSILPSFVCELLSLFTILVISLRRRILFTPNPIDVVKNISPRPILITHGKEDTIVPFSHGMDLYDAALEPKSCLWVPNCDHTMVFNVDPNGWKRKITEVLKKVMKKAKRKPNIVDSK